MDDNSTSTCSPCTIRAGGLFVTFLLNNNEYTNPAAAAWEKDIYEGYTNSFNDYMDGHIDMSLPLHQEMNKRITAYQQ